VLVKKEIGILKYPKEYRVEFGITHTFQKVIKRGVKAENENVDVLNGLAEMMFCCCHRVICTSWH
jgi:hypothetical protein